MADSGRPTITRLLDAPIVQPSSHPSLGSNINGPSLVRMPDWAHDALGRYHLYFAHHKGSFIRLAHAEDPCGPWHIHEPGALGLGGSHFLTEPPSVAEGELDALRSFYEEVLGSSELAHSLATEATTPHIASPDVQLDHDGRRFVMYFHGLEGVGTQVSRVALSADGVTFEARPEVIAMPYLRAFAHDGWTYGMTMPGGLVRSADGLSGFETGPTLFEPAMRHCAVLVRGEVLHVLWTRVGDAPECILHSTIDMSGDWSDWTATPGVEVMRPERSWEGAHLPAQPSIRSVAPDPVNQLRDPALLEDDDGRILLVYAVAGESGLGMAEIHF